MSTASSRRSHTKSRHGCAICKQRHIKCDETRPRCVNCATAGFQCPFSDFSVAESHSAVSTPVESGTSLETSPVDPAPIVSPPPTSIYREEELNLEHIELIYHFMNETFATLAEIPSQQALWRDVAMRDAFHNPFLMYGILAISALHLSYCKPQRAAHYGGRAVELQTIAIRKFSLSLPKVSEDSFGPAMLFMGMLAAHVFADPVRSSHRNFNDFLDHISKSVKLSRGSRYIVKSFWKKIHESQYAPLVDVDLIESGGALEKSKLPQEMLDLSRLIDSDRALGSTYAPTIFELQRVYLSNFQRPRRRSRFSSLLSWMMLVPDSYHDALEQRRPEALVILAYYAALLHHQRDHWAVGNAGMLLIEGINEHLGSRWSQWLEWPVRETTVEKT